MTSLVTVNFSGRSLLCGLTGWRVLYLLHLGVFSSKTFRHLTSEMFI